MPNWGRRRDDKPGTDWVAKKAAGGSKAKDTRTKHDKTVEPNGRMDEQILDELEGEGKK